MTLPRQTMRFYQQDGSYRELQPGIDSIGETRHALRLSGVVAIVFNLPESMVLTLTEFKVKNQPLQDLRRCGQTVDLVGRSTEANSLTKTVHTKDKMEGFAQYFWRYIDLDMGAFELFARKNFQGFFLRIYLSDWEPLSATQETGSSSQRPTMHNMDGWYMAMRVRSIRYHAVDPTVRIYVFGKTQTYDRTNYAGWLQERHDSDLYAEHPTSQYLYGKGFAWAEKSCVRQHVQDITIDDEHVHYEKFLAKSFSLVNSDRVSVAKEANEITLKYSEVQTVKAETTWKSMAGLQASLKDPISGSSLSAKLESSLQSLTGEQTAVTQECTVKTTLEMEVGPRMKKTGAIHLLNRRLHGMKCKAIVHRWYDIHIPGSTVDGNYWKRTLHVPITVSTAGQVGFHVLIQKEVSEAEPLPEDDNDSTSIVSSFISNLWGPVVWGGVVFLSGFALLYGTVSRSGNSKK